MKKMAMAALLGLAACGEPDVRTYAHLIDPYYLSSVTPQMMAGTWHVAANYPVWYEAGCSHQTFEFQPRPDGLLDLEMRCQRPDGQLQVTGTAKPVGLGQLQIVARETWYPTDLLLLDLSPDRQTLVLGTPLRTGGWVLHRDRRITPQELDRARDVYDRNNYDVAAMLRMNQR
jgi:apolipoprotein D and lipocalin family protein